jgi:hypothetical protein
MLRILRPRQKIALAKFAGVQFAIVLSRVASRTNRRMNPTSFWVGLQQEAGKPQGIISLIPINESLRHLQYALRVWDIRHSIKPGLPGPVPVFVSCCKAANCGR